MQNDMDTSGPEVAAERFGAKKESLCWVWGKSSGLHLANATCPQPAVLRPIATDVVQVLATRSLLSATRRTTQHSVGPRT